jgi:HSP20 family molecular chaperone IbpA
LRPFASSAMDCPRTLADLAEGREQPWQHSRNAMTRVLPVNYDDTGSGRNDSRGWTVLAGEIRAGGRDRVIRIGLPAVYRDGRDIALARNQLHVSGKRRHDRGLIDAKCYVRECACGRRTRSSTASLPVDADRAPANFGNGAFTVKGPKLKGGSGHRLQVIWPTASHAGRYRDVEPGRACPYLPAQLRSSAVGPMRTPGTGAILLFARGYC